MESGMPEKRPKPDLTISELFGVAGVVGCGDYAISLIHNFNAASTFSGVLHSADVGVTASFGAIAYCAYRYFRPRAT
jgi:hypothetical protein